ncbi:hypothetical protein PTH_0079 [Pelotomaculum thermopropionicum SI]|uniref:Uncharacterized protein n=1 Tax=Pelotomaculum thermopropionicum (strain DSM 13744 / JCM 10971 / SI) TaxID=370438 RepID=A5D671_PELTS|nr:hypothetical protein PTH_0079 [Pelotomaculum thermopropionicum SI]
MAGEGIARSQHFNAFGVPDIFTAPGNHHPAADHDHLIHRRRNYLSGSKLAAHLPAVPVCDLPGAALRSFPPLLRYPGGTLRQGNGVPPFYLIRQRDLFHFQSGIYPGHNYLRALDNCRLSPRRHLVLRPQDNAAFGKHVPHRLPSCPDLNFTAVNGHANLPGPLHRHHHTFSQRCLRRRVHRVLIQQHNIQFFKNSPYRAGKSPHLGSLPVNNQHHRLFSPGIAPGRQKKHGAKNRRPQEQNTPLPGFPCAAAVFSAGRFQQCAPVHSMPPSKKVRHFKCINHLPQFLYAAKAFFHIMLNGCRAGNFLAHFYFTTSWRFWVDFIFVAFDRLKNDQK